MVKNFAYGLLIVLLLSGCAGAAASPTAAPLLATQTAAQPAPAVTVLPSEQDVEPPAATVTPSPTVESYTPHPLQIEVMRQQAYPGSPLTFEQTLVPGANYARYVVSYISEGYKIYALMTVPYGDRPATGWPAIVFNHGYIAPDQYRTTERYVDYVDAIAQRGYIVLKIDYRGHDNSDGVEVVGGGYGTSGYAADALNALASLQQYEEADPQRIGMWGHSMGGQVVLRAMAASGQVKAGVIWAGVVAPYPEIIQRWDYRRNPERTPPRAGQSSGSSWRQKFSDWVLEFTTEYGEPADNPAFWDTVSPNSYLAELSGPIQLHHSDTDERVPLVWSEILAGGLQNANVPYEYYIYEGDNHNISANFSTAMQRSIDFFDRYVKN